MLAYILLRTSMAGTDSFKNKCWRLRDCRAAAATLNPPGGHEKALEFINKLPFGFLRLGVFRHFGLETLPSNRELFRQGQRGETFCESR